MQGLKMLLGVLLIAAGVAMIGASMVQYKEPLHIIQSAGDVPTFTLVERGSNARAVQHQMEFIGGGQNEH